MKAPDIRVYNTDLVQLHKVRRWSSLTFSRAWQSVGEPFTLTVPEPTERDKEVLKIGNLIVLDQDGDRCGRICDVTYTADRSRALTIKGYHLNWLLSRRLHLRNSNATLAVTNHGYDVVPWQLQNGLKIPDFPAETVLKTYIDRHMVNPDDENRGIQQLTIAPDQGRGKAMSWAAEEFKTLENTFAEIGSYADIGFAFRADLAGKRMEFDVVPGVDRTVDQRDRRSIVFSLRNKNTSGASYQLADTDYKNTAYAAGAEGADGLRKTRIVTNERNVPSGIDRAEIAIDCGTLDDYETATQMCMQTEAEHDLAQYKRTEKLQVDAEPVGRYEYRKDWDVGDLVICRLEDLGREIPQRITAVTESYSPGSYKVTPTFGDNNDGKVRLIRALKKTI